MPRRKPSVVKERRKSARLKNDGGWTIDNLCRGEDTLFMTDIIDLSAGGIGVQFDEDELSDFPLTRGRLYDLVIGEPQWSSDARLVWHDPKTNRAGFAFTTGPHLDSLVQLFGVAPLSRRTSPSTKRPSAKASGRRRPSR